MKNKIILKDDYELSKPSQLQAMSLVLREHIVNNKLYVPIAGRNYVQVEGWQFAGGLLKMFPKVAEVVNLSQGNEIKWQAKVELIQNDKVISVGYAVCSNKEGKKKTFDEYAVLSMAQTRAIGKAYRNIIGWVMKLSGYEPTPAEEVKPGIVADKKEEVPKIEAECSECGEPITKAEKEFSLKLYKKTLCRKCQALKKKK
jgi:hypothetical protein